MPRRSKGARGRKARRYPEDRKNREDKEEVEDIDKDEETQESDAEEEGEEAKYKIFDKVVSFFEERPYFYDVSHEAYCNRKKKDSEVAEFAASIGWSRKYFLRLTHLWQLHDELFTCLYKVDIW